LVEGIADAFALFIDRYGGFFRTKTRNSAAVAGRYLRGLVQAEDCTFTSMATAVDEIRWLAPQASIAITVGASSSKNATISLRRSFLRRTGASAAFIPCN
jgi:hypothetical protein